MPNNQNAMEPMDDKCLVVHIEKIVEGLTLFFFSFASSIAKIKSIIFQTKDKFNLAVT